MEIRKISAAVFLLLMGYASTAQETPLQETSLYEKGQFISGQDTLRYRILYPENFNEDTSYPLVLFLHGSGERGNDNEKQLMHGSDLFTQASHRKEFPAIIVFPQCPEDDYWSNVEVDRSTNPVGLEFNYEKGPTKAMDLVTKMVDEFTANNYVNNHRVYVMGLSMGGMGTFELLAQKPDVFAAAVPICGGGEAASVENYAKKVPLWVFHGAQDNVVNPQESVTMVASILDAGGHPRFTLYDEAGHNSWDSAFAEPDLLPWLFSHSKIRE